MLAVSIKRGLLVLLLFSQIGCSSFISSESRNRSQIIEVGLSTAWQVNPDKYQSSQPVKICVIETRRAGWLPPRLYEGRICSDLSNSADIINYEVYILAPGQNKTYRTSVEVAGKFSRWIVVGAEFRRGIGEYSLIEKVVEPGSDFKMDINAENTSLTVL
ncbi:type VI secretion lipoprotein TssJ [Serratia sp. AKBS12]|uniref:type VI secretion lipoprotein TssJ n=1 Tax=Serratia sp. AKBS12 TaxID=2974597 RepID=UPI002165F66B|nr:type VI secretion lipoprotein TssJ [Serratia sp. AKBS12]